MSWEKGRALDFWLGNPGHWPTLIGSPELKIGGDGSSRACCPGDPAAPRSPTAASVGPQRLVLPGAPWRNSASRLPGPPSFRCGSGWKLHRDPRDPRGQRPSSARQEAGPGNSLHREPQRWHVSVGPTLRIPGGVVPLPPAAPSLTVVTTQAQTTLPRGRCVWGVASGGCGGVLLYCSVPHTSSSSGSGTRLALATSCQACGCACSGANNRSSK